MFLASLSEILPSLLKDEKALHPRAFPIWIQKSIRTFQFGPVLQTSPNNTPCPPRSVPLFRPCRAPQRSRWTSRGLRERDGEDGIPAGPESIEVRSPNKNPPKALLLQARQLQSAPGNPESSKTNHRPTGKELCNEIGRSFLPALSPLEALQKPCSPAEAACDTIEEFFFPQVQDHLEILLLLVLAWTGWRPLLLETHTETQAEV